MKLSIRDRDALHAVGPDALLAYALSMGWKKVESYGDHSDVFAAGRLPEIILPRTQWLGDYASVVARIIGVFAKIEGRDEIAVYIDLVNADCDTVRVRAEGIDDRRLTVNDGVDLFSGMRDMILATVCSLRQTTDVLNRVHWERTERDSFVATLAIPNVDQACGRLFPQPDGLDTPAERRMTRHLIESVSAAKHAAESMVAGNVAAFSKVVEKGVSADLCEALDRMTSPFQRMDVSVMWARTLPMKPRERIVQFTRADASILREAGRSLRTGQPGPREL